LTLFSMESSSRGDNAETELSQILSIAF